MNKYTSGQEVQVQISRWRNGFPLAVVTQSFAADETMHERLQTAYINAYRHLTDSANTLWNKL